MKKNLLSLLIACALHNNYGIQDNKVAKEVLSNEMRNLEYAKLLITADADINANNNDGNIELIWAAWNNNTEIVQLLITAGADVNARDLVGDSVLRLAAKHGRTEIVQLLRTH